MPVLDTNLVAGRLFDFFGRRTPWHRRLWAGGLLTALEEAAEFGELVIAVGQGNEQLLGYRRFLRDEVSQDRGLAPAQRDQLVAILSAKPFPMQSIRELRHLRAQVAPTYVSQWRSAAEQGDAPLERLARTLASSLLEAGFSPSGLHRWLTGVMSQHPPVAVEVLVDAVDQRMHLPTREWRVIVPVEQVPFRRHPRPENYLEAADATALLPKPLPTEGMVRLNGALVFGISAKDRYGAATKAADRLRRIASRVTVGLPGEAVPVIAEIAWVHRADEDPAAGSWAPLREAQRSVEIGTLFRQRVVFDLPDRAAALDDAFQLLASVESSSPGSAIIGGWAAIESLLRGPDERGGEIAAQRMAAVVACALPRAELTPLAHAYRKANHDTLAVELRQCTTNLELADCLERAIRDGAALAFASPSDAAALLRLQSFIDSPATLGRVRRYLTTAFLRLYRLRNLVMHGGSARSVATEAVIGTAPALIGAGIDRIAHSLLSADPPIDPLALAARATINLDQASMGLFRNLARLLAAP